MYKVALLLVVGVGVARWWRWANELVDRDESLLAWQEDQDDDVFDWGS